MIRRLLILVEEESKEQFLRALIQRMNAPATLQITFLRANGYPDIVRLMRTRLRAWHVPDTHVLVVCDQDSADCADRKHALEREVPDHLRPHTTIRIACEELEAWYLGDRAALTAVLPTLAGILGKRPFHRPPDQIRNPASQIARHASLHKVEHAPQMGELISLTNSTSVSFSHLAETLGRLLDRAQQAR